MIFYGLQFLFLVNLLIPAYSAVISASYRKDIYLERFPESIPYHDPTDGGRVHVVIEECQCENITSVQVNSQEALNLPNSGTLDFSYFDWSRLFQTEDGRVWISFHSRNTDWLKQDSSSSLQIQLSDTTGECYSGNVDVNPVQDVLITYVTTKSNGSELIVHIHNSGILARSVTSLSVNGQLIKGPWTIGAKQTRVSVFPAKLVPGDIWTGN